MAVRVPLIRLPDDGMSMSIVKFRWTNLTYKPVFFDILWTFSEEDEEFPKNKALVFALEPKAILNSSYEVNWSILKFNDAFCCTVSSCCKTSFTKLLVADKDGWLIVPTTVFAGKETETVIGLIVAVIGV